MDISHIEAGHVVRLSSLTTGMQADTIKAGVGFSASGMNGRSLFRDIEAAEYFSVGGSIGQIILDSVRSA